MGKKYRNLISKICEWDNLMYSFRKAFKAAKHCSEKYVFKEHLFTNLEEIKRELLKGTYKRGKYYTFQVWDPKKRIVYVLPFKDRVIQQAIYNIIAPIFDKMFYPSSYACRKKKGTHKCVKDTQSIMRKTNCSHYIKMDFKSYFKSIDSDILMDLLGKKITDYKLLEVLSQFVSIEGVPGIPLGNLLSQLFANIYGHLFDKYVHEEIKTKEYRRYVDDTTVFCEREENAKIIKKELENYSKSIGLKFSRWGIYKINQPLNFLGYRILADYKLVRKENVRRAKAQVKKIKGEEELKGFLSAWKGHIMWADSYNLKKNLEEYHDFSRRFDTNDRKTGGIRWGSPCFLLGFNAA